MEMKPYIVTINADARVRVFAYDATGACGRAACVYEYTTRNPQPVGSIQAEADLKSANIEPLKLAARG